MRRSVRRAVISTVYATVSEFSRQYYTDNVTLNMLMLRSCRLLTYNAQEDALGVGETRELQAVQPAGESSRKELQVSGEAAEHSRLQQAEHRAGDFRGRATREQPRQGHLKTRYRNVEHYPRTGLRTKRAEDPRAIAPKRSTFVRDRDRGELNY